MNSKLISDDPGRYCSELVNYSPVQFNTPYIVFVGQCFRKLMGQLREQLNIKMTQPKHMVTESPPHSEGSDSAQGSNQEESSHSEPPFVVDQIVWVKVKGHTIWPGTVSLLVTQNFTG